MTPVLIMLLIFCIGAACFSVIFMRIYNTVNSILANRQKVLELDKMCFSCIFMSFKDGVIKCLYELPIHLEDQTNKIIIFEEKGMKLGKLPKDGECKTYKRAIYDNDTLNTLTILKYNTLRAIYGMEHT